MPNGGANYADRKLKATDDALRKVYTQAEKELQKKLADFTRRNRQKDRLKRKQLAEGKITLADYQSWQKGQIFQQERWERKVKQVQQTIHNSNVEAARIVNDKKLDVYADAYFRAGFELEGVTGISFELYSGETVARLIDDRDQLLPEWKIDEPKDYKWNYNKVNNAVTQGIIQGESVDDVANRLCKQLCTQNENKMRMFARTAINEAQSAGRQQQMDDAAKMGIEQLKQWLATLDSRTRDVHRHLDGDEVPYDKPFKSDLGEIRFPCDPQADPANVYNCRCTMVTIYPKFRKQQDNWRQNETIDGKTYDEWKELKTNATGKEAQKKAEQGTNNLTRVGQKKNIEDADEKLRAIKQIENINDDEAERIAKALYGYHGNPESCWCDGRDSAIRSETTKKDAEDAALLQKYVDNSPKYDGTIYRGMGVNQETLEVLQIGAKFSEEKYALSSWSSREDVARRYASRSANENGNTRVVFEIENHTHGAPIAHISLYETEQEVLVNNKNVQYEITERKQVDVKGRTFIWIKLAEVGK